MYSGRYRQTVRLLDLYLYIWKDKKNNRITNDFESISLLILYVIRFVPTNYRYSCFNHLIIERSTTLAPEASMHFIEYTR